MSPGQVIALFERKNKEIEHLKAANGEMRKALEDVLAVMNESRGVEGWYLHGDIASWEEIGMAEKVAAALEKAWT